MTTCELFTTFYDKVARTVSREFACDDYTVEVWYTRPECTPVEHTHIVRITLFKHIYNTTYACTHEFDAANELDLRFLKRLRVVMKLKWAKMATTIHQENLFH